MKILQGKFTKFSLSEVFPSRWYQHSITCGIINDNHRDFPSTGAKPGGVACCGAEPAVSLQNVQALEGEVPTGTRCGYF